MATIIVPILEVKKPKFREEKLSDLPKVTQLISIELDLNLSSCVPKPTLRTTHHRERRGVWEGVQI